MSNLELWTCAHNGVTQAEVDALGVARWHNWGSFRSIPGGPGRVPLVSLRLDAVPILDTGPGDLVMFGNEPQMPPPDGDGFTSGPHKAGYQAGWLGSRVGGQIIVGNFFCADESKMAGTCYDGAAQTANAGPEYWEAYRGGLFSEAWSMDFQESWGIHYYTRTNTFDAQRCIGILEEYHEWCQGDVYLTELGVEPWGFDVVACMGFMDQLVMWAVGKPWMRAICWSQWPTRHSDSGLWQNDHLTPLGIYWRDLGERIKGLGPVVDPPEPGASQWELVSQYPFESIQSDGQASDTFRVTIEREVRA